MWPPSCARPSPSWPGPSGAGPRVREPGGRRDRGHERRHRGQASGPRSSTPCIPSLVDRAPARHRVRDRRIPSGGDPLFRPDTGVSQYFGIGGYLRPLNAAAPRRRALRRRVPVLATPPEPDAVTRLRRRQPGRARPPVEGALHHDPGRSWDMDDVRAFYMRRGLRGRPARERYSDAERALDLGRATNAFLIRPCSPSGAATSAAGGGLVLGLNDLRRGRAGACST